MKDLFIYHPGTGTVIPLSDAVYLCDSASIDADTLEEIEYGVSDISDRYHKGFRLDNYNMTNLFFGGAK